MRRTAADTEAMEALGRELGRLLRAGDLVVLTGPLGAGKTTLTRGIGEGLRVRGPVQSPTFVLARTHPSLVGAAPLVHVDAYRLSGAAELEDLDLDFANSVVVAEWGAGLLDDVADSWLEVVIERRRGGDATDAVHDGAGADDLEADEPRTVRLVGHGPRWAGTPYAAAPALGA
ncbi:tRNA (adenosine(37)-N6)-threonylcarbamoyltransferase complex ATPase subunit type 1 TsaE [Agromyces sp. NPDC056523]|uniref:tRNA (adenosine(37)-N6)-threonylcarbamoyltransferase complex ATPase subunit type 1 TsaE n=1 Tax=Agromyces sp. NPDC056523 TaxID=3345850 RepID=UPI003670EAB7